MTEAVTDLLVMGGSAGMGQGFRLAASAVGAIGKTFINLSTHRFEQAIHKHDAHEASKEAASARGGTLTRRWLVVAVLMVTVGVFFLPAITGDPIVVEVVREKGGFLWGLWPKKEITEFITVNGPLFINENRRAFLAILSFYLGQGIK
jgi:hypothetical protein